MQKLLVDRQDLDLSKLVRKHREEWEVSFARCGVAGQTLNPSLESPRRRNEQPQPYTQSEYSIHTGPLLVLLLFYCVQRHKKNDQVRSAAMLAGLLCVMLDESWLDRTVLRRHATAAAHLCQHNHEGGFCMHVRAFRDEDLEAARGRPDAPSLAVAPGPPVREP